MCRSSACLDILAEIETNLTKVRVDYYYYYYYHHYHHHHYHHRHYHHHHPTGCCAKIKLYLQEMVFRALHFYYALPNTHVFLMLWLIGQSY
jgi:hypothetical protein